MNWAGGALELSGGREGERGGSEGGRRVRAKRRDGRGECGCLGDMFQNYQRLQLWARGGGRVEGIGGGSVGGGRRVGEKLRDGICRRVRVSRVTMAKKKTEQLALSSAYIYSSHIQFLSTLK